MQGTRLVPVSSVTVGQRHRKKLGDLKPLAESIGKIGLLHPILVNDDGLLIVGERRLAACRDVLGWSEIPARVTDLQDILQAEHDENELRANFTPSERVALVDALRTYTHGGSRGGGRHAKDDEKNQRRPGDVEKTEGDGLTVSDAAAKVGDTKDDYYRAKKVTTNGTAELVEAMDDGAIPIKTAARVADLPEPDQQEVVNRVRSGEKPSKVAEESGDKRAKTKDRAKTVQEAIKAYERLMRLMDELGLYEKHKPYLEKVYKEIQQG